MQYISFRKGMQTLFLKSIKRKTSLSWSNISTVLGVNRSMLYFYLNEHSKLSYTSYCKLCTLAKVKKKNVSIIEIKNKPVKIKRPVLSSKLAEFLGALAGDGHLSGLTYEVSISLDKDLDKAYSKHILVLFKDLFGIEARQYIQENKIKCFVYSKELINFLSSTYALPIGKKKGKLHIPKQIVEDTILLKAYLRGIFDTDGSFHRHHEKTAMAGFISRDSLHLSEIKLALEKLGFTPSLNQKNLYIYRKKEIDLFFKVILPSNEKHVFKYDMYKKYGIVPLTKNFLER